MVEKGRGHMAGGHGPCKGQGVRSQLRKGAYVGQERGRAGEVSRLQGGGLPCQVKSLTPSSRQLGSHGRCMSKGIIRQKHHFSKTYMI